MPKYNECIDALRAKLHRADDPRAAILLDDMIQLATERSSFAADFSDWIASGSIEDLTDLAKTFAPLRNNPPLVRAVESINIAREVFVQCMSAEDYPAIVSPAEVQEYEEVD